MKKDIFHTCFLLAAFFIAGRAGAQDIHFSQFYESPLLLNPATAGSGNSDCRLAVNYKNQWKSVINPFKTAAIAFDTKLFNKDSARHYLGLGVSLFNDKVGAAKFTTNQANIDLAYHLQFNSKNRISAGVKSGLFQKYINSAGLRWDNQYNGRDYDASRPTGELMNNNNYSSFDLGAGILYTHTTENGMQLRAGGSVAHLTRPKNSFYSNDESTQMKYTGHLQAQYQTKDKKYILLPSALYVRQGGHQEIVAGSNIAFLLSEQNKFSSAVHFGAFYRYKDAVIFMAALEYKKNMKFGMSYDVTVSGFTSASRFRGGPEFSFVYTGFRREKKKPEEVKDTVAQIPVIVPEEKAPMGVYKGAIYGEEDKPVNAEITVTPLSPDTTGALQPDAENALNSVSDSSSGKYQVALMPGKVYKVRITAPGFEPYEEQVNLVTLNKYVETQKDVHLTRQKSNEKKPLLDSLVKKEVENKTPCSGQPAPDVSALKGKSMKDPATYQQMLGILRDYCDEGLDFKIQVAAYRKPKNYKYDHLKEYGQPQAKTYPDGITRFTLSEFKTVKEAEALRLKVIEKGQDDAFISVFVNGKRLSLEELIKLLESRR